MIKAKFKDDHFIIICPQCNKFKKVRYELLAGSRTAKMRCACGYFFDVEVEHRGFFRKETGLEGFFQRVANLEEWGRVRWDSEVPKPQSMNCRITDISRTGLGFTPLREHAVSVGHLLTISFTLDDAANRTCLKKVIVRGVNGNKISCEFAEDDRVDPKIGFYLL